jgi:site-specific DNA recombinase
VRMERLDEIVIRELGIRILDPHRLRSHLDTYLQPASERAGREKAQLDKLRHGLRDVEARLSRLLDLVELGEMSVTDPNLKERLSALRLQRDELTSEIAYLQHRIASGQPEITAGKLERFAATMRENLLNGDPALRQIYARLLTQEVVVTDHEIRITGSKAILARAASKELDSTAPAVLSFVREWRSLGESNPSFKIENLAS